MNEHDEAYVQDMLKESMDLMANMYHSAELSNANAGRLNGIRVRLCEVARVLNLEIGEKALSRRKHDV